MDRGAKQGMLTKGDQYSLMMGMRLANSCRLLGGIATSLLFSAFESWIVAEHLNKGLEEKWLGDTFSKVGGWVTGEDPPESRTDRW